MIDWKRIAELRDEIGAEDFGDVVELFLEEVEGEIALLREGCAEDALESRLHFLKGSALNLGFRAFSTLCQNGESAAAAGQAQRVDLPATLASFDDSKTEFMAGLSRLDKS
ncbi:Hpt domain-containing protein [Roseovarius sp. Pro17]|uniref:Hpt domain-containing protein n=1 Tax=Roseovarius sp. Pro17 TaxID=3108175 RepID=UPI002D78E191|nr:Hpt domain-containing protein [Roseovarius sp. Pro17]